MKKNDIFLGIYLLAAVVFLIIPIPSTMLDWLILFNISMSLIIVFNCYERDTEYVWISDTVAFYDSVPYILKCIFHTIDLVDR